MDWPTQESSTLNFFILPYTTRWMRDKGNVTVIRHVRKVIVQPQNDMTSAPLISFPLKSLLGIRQCWRSLSLLYNWLLLTRSKSYAWRDNKTFYWGALCAPIKMCYESLNGQRQQINLPLKLAATSVALIHGTGRCQVRPGSLFSRDVPQCCCASASPEALWALEQDAHYIFLLFLSRRKTATTMERCRGVWNRMSPLVPAQAFGKKLKSVYVTG